MTFFTISTIGLLVLGIGIMTFAIYSTRSMFPLLEKSKYLSRWRILAGLMGFFLLGYLGAIALVLTDQLDWLITLVGIIFMMGGLFVFLVVRMSRLTVGELVESEQLVTAARDQAIDALRWRKELMARMTHELRTPLHAITGYTDMLDSGHYGELNDKQNEINTRIAANSDRLIMLINTILEQTKIEAGTLVLEQKPFDVETLSQRVNQVIFPLAQKKMLAFHQNISPALSGRLVGDIDRLHEIVVNLAGNAVKFTPAGRINIAYKPAEDGQCWLIEVSDTGFGIPEEQQALIFEPFRQVDGSITREIGGSGLGLSIVKQLAELMGGQVTVQSRPGHGSTFSVQLPMVLAAEEKIYA